MESLHKFTKELLKYIYDCCYCGRENDSNEEQFSSKETPVDDESLLKTNNIKSVSLDLPLEKRTKIQNIELKRENILENIEKIKNLDKMDNIKSITSKVGNGLKGVTDSIVSKTRNLKNKNSGSGDSPLKKITSKLHIKPRKNGGRTPRGGR